MKLILQAAVPAIFAALLTLSSETQASPPVPADSVHFCLPVDPEQLQRDESSPAGKWASDLNVGEPRTVRLFYFLPNDRPYRTEVVDSMKAGILDLQTFFAEQMDARGQGNTTFQIETDDQGDPVVHHVDGDYGDSRYSSRGYTDGEIGRAFDNSSNIILIVMDVSASSAHGRGTGSKSSGWAMVYGAWNWFAAAHELGHAFGLHHDFRDNEYIMSYGRAERSSARLSTCAAEFLAAHPYFNPDVPLENASPPTVELVSSEFPFGSVSTPVQLRVRDDDGLHQVILFVQPRNPFLGGTPEVKACAGLSGETETVVEFNFDGRLPSDNVGTVAEAHTTLSNMGRHPIYVVAVDTAGNRTSTVSLKSFALEAGHSPQYIATLDYPAGNLAFSPDGTTIALGRGGIVSLYDASTSEWITEFRHTAGNRYGNRVTFSPDGTLLASGSGNGTIKVWNVASREIIATLEGHTNRISSVDFSTDGTLLVSGASDNTVKLWNASTWTNRATLDHTHGIALVAFLPDGTLAFKDFGGTVTLWDVTTESQISTIETAARSSGIAISADGATLASGSLYSIKLWDLTTGTQIGTLNHMRDYPYATMAFSPDGTILAVSANGLIEIWDVLTNQLLASISGGPGGVGELLFSPDGTQLVSTGNVKFWDVSEWTAPTTPETAVLNMTVGGGPSAALRGYNPHSHPDWNFGSLSSRTIVLDGVTYTLHKLVYSVAGNRLQFQTSPMLRAYELHLDTYVLRSFSANDYNLHLWENVNLNWSVGQSIRIRVVEADPVPPDPPTKLIATQGDKKVTLSWEHPANADPTTLPITEYEFRLSDDGGSTWDQDWQIIPDSRSGQVNRTGFTVEEFNGDDLVNGKSYTFEIRARGGDGPGRAERATAVPGGTTTTSTDFNGDGKTDFVDFFLFADAYGGTNARFDLDGNGRVDFADFFRFVDAFGT